MNKPGWEKDPRPRYLVVNADEGEPGTWSVPLPLATMKIVAAFPWKSDYLPSVLTTNGGPQQGPRDPAR